MCCAILDDFLLPICLAAVIPERTIFSIHGVIYISPKGICWVPKTSNMALNMSVQVLNFVIDFDCVPHFATSLP